MASHILIKSLGNWILIISVVASCTAKNENTPTQIETFWDVEEIVNSITINEG